MQTNQLIDKIIDLDTRHYAVAQHLLNTMCDDDPELAETWIELIHEDSTDRYGFLSLPETIFRIFHSHVRYGYVIEWLWEWSVESYMLKEALAERLPRRWSDIDDVLCTEMESRMRPLQG